MSQNDRNQTTGRNDQNYSGCPFCGTTIDGFNANTPAAPRVDPCGHPVVDASVEDNGLIADGGVTLDDVGGLRRVVPDDLQRIQRETVAEIEDADHWMIDIPVCLHCHTAHGEAHGGGKQTLEVDGVELVAEYCADCDQETNHVLEVTE